METSQSNEGLFPEFKKMAMGQDLPWRRKASKDSLPGSQLQEKDKKQTYTPRHRVSLHQNTRQSGSSEVFNLSTDIFDKFLVDKHKATQEQSNQPVKKTSLLTRLFSKPAGKPPADPNSEGLLDLKDPSSVSFPSPPASQQKRSAAGGGAKHKVAAPTLASGASEGKHPQISGGRKNRYLFGESKRVSSCDAPLPQKIDEATIFELKSSIHEIQVEAPRDSYLSPMKKSHSQLDKSNREGAKGKLGLYPTFDDIQPQSRRNQSTSKKDGHVPQVRRIPRLFRYLQPEGFKGEKEQEPHAAEAAEAVNDSEPRELHPPPDEPNEPREASLPPEQAAAKAYLRRATLQQLKQKEDLKMKYAHEYLQQKKSHDPRPDWQRYNQAHPLLALLFFFVGMVGLGVLAYFSKWFMHKQTSDPIETYYAVNFLTFLFVGVFLWICITQEEKKVRAVQKKELEQQFSEMRDQLQQVMSLNQDGDEQGVNIKALCSTHLRAEVGQILLPRLEVKAKPLPASEGKAEPKGDSTIEIRPGDDDPDKVIAEEEKEDFTPYGDEFSDGSSTALYLDKASVLQEISELQRELLRDDEKLKSYLPRYLSEDFNLLLVRKADRGQFWKIGLALGAGFILYYYSLQLIHFRIYSLVVLIAFGGLLPSVMNLRVRLWMTFECKIKNYLQLPTTCELIIDWLNLALVLIGVGIILFGIGIHSSQMQEQSIVDPAVLSMVTIKTDHDGERRLTNKYHDMLAFALALLAGCCFGIGFAEIRILTHFKEIREKCYQQNYNYLKPLIHSLFLSQFLVPLLAYPSSASLEISQQATIAEAQKQGHPLDPNLIQKSIGLKVGYYFGAAALLTLTLNSLGTVLQHQNLSLNSIQLLICVIPSLTAILLEVFITREGEWLADVSAKELTNLLTLVISVFLLTVPQAILFIYRMFSDACHERRRLKDQLPYKGEASSDGEGLLRNNKVEF